MEEDQTELVQQDKEGFQNEATDSVKFSLCSNSNN
jgi:hypothetical protein